MSNVEWSFWDNEIGVRASVPRRLAEQAELLFEPPERTFMVKLAGGEPVATTPERYYALARSAPLRRMGPAFVRDTLAGQVTYGPGNEMILRGESFVTRPWTAPERGAASGQKRVRTNARLNKM